MTLSIVVAMDRRGLIGREGGLPWHLPGDLRRFRRLTMGKPVIMGRATFESIGRPLDGRTNIIVSRREGYRAEGCLGARSLAQAIELARADLAAKGQDEVMVIGGAEVFREALGLADRVHLTIVEGEFEGSTYFPGGGINLDDWVVRSEEAIPADEKDRHPRVDRVLERKRP